MNFPYIEFRGLAEERIFRPMIPITFETNKFKFDTYALVDSGADYTMLPIETASKFKFKLSDQPNYKMQGAGGNIFTIYKSPVKLQLRIKKKGFQDLKWDSYVYFAESEPTTLLGQKGFCELFKISLHGSKKEVEIIH